VTKIPDFFPREQFFDIRAKLRLSQAKLGKILGVTEMTISRWENSKVAVPKTVGLAMLYLAEHCEPTKKKIRIKEIPDERKVQPGPVVTFSDPGAA
jgi:transcriptional regulator with XRE-family HTH domain